MKFLPITEAEYACFSRSETNPDLMIPYGFEVAR